MIWRERRGLLAVLAALLLANAVFFFTYRVRYENRLNELDGRLDQVKAELQQAHRGRMAAEQQLAGYRKIQDDIKTIYDVRWSTQQARLTTLIEEVKRLGTATQLVPRVYAFSRVQSKPQAVKTAQAAPGTTEVGIAFVVSGKYDQVRRLINLMELSDQFLIIDQVGLSAADGDNLNLTIHVKTLFRDAPAAPRNANQEL